MFEFVLNPIKEIIAIYNIIDENNEFWKKNN